MAGWPVAGRNSVPALLLSPGHLRLRSAANGRSERDRRRFPWEADPVQDWSSVCQRRRSCAHDHRARVYRTLSAHNILRYCIVRSVNIQICRIGLRKSRWSVVDAEKAVAAGESSQENGNWSRTWSELVRVDSSSHDDAVARASRARPTIDSEPRYVHMQHHVQ